MRVVNRLGGDQESLLLTRLPRVDQVAVTAGAFATEVASVPVLAFRYQRAPVFPRPLPAVLWLAAAIPDAEDDPPLHRAVHLHPEVAAVPAARHVISPYRIFQRRDL